MCSKVFIVEVSGYKWFVVLKKFSVPLCLCGEKSLAYGELGLKVRNT